jgi:hypothetical protein
MKGLVLVVPLMTATILTGCAPYMPGAHMPGGYVNLTSIPANQTMTVDAAEKLVDARMGIIGWSKAPKGMAQSKSNQYKVCAISGATNTPFRFISLSGSSFVATAAKGFATFLFSQPGQECPTQLLISDITQSEAMTLASALTVLANAERIGARQSSADPDKDQWAKISGSNDPADFQSFLMSYSSSSLSDQAFERLMTTRRAAAVAKAKTIRKPVTAPLLPPPVGLVMATGPNVSKMSGTNVTASSRTKIVSGDLNNFVEETTTNTSTSNDSIRSQSRTDAVAVYRGPYSLFARPGKSTTSSTMNMSGDTSTTSKSTMEIWLDGGSGDMNSLFPLAVGNAAQRQYVQNMSYSTTHTAGILQKYGTNSSTTRSEVEESCIVEDYRPVRVGGSSMDSFKIFCVIKTITAVNNVRSPNYTFIDYFYSTKLRTIVKSVSSSTYLTGVNEVNYTVITNPG